MNQLEINKKELELLKSEYQSAVKGNKKSFTFQGHELLTDYAKYLIQSLELKFKNK